MTRERILAVRGDGPGDVLLAEPALRALAEDGEVTLLCSAAGRAAVDVIPAVARTVVHDLPWLVADGTPVDPDATRHLIDAVRELAPRRAVIFTSPGQPALPTALLLRLAGVPFVAARSLDRPGPLLDVRLSHDPVEHEVDRNLELVEALGLPAPFDRRIRVDVGRSPVSLPAGAVVIHGSCAPLGPSVSHSSMSALWLDVVEGFRREERPVILTGARGDRCATPLRSAAGVAIDLVGRTTFPELAAVFDAADVVCTARSGAMQLAAAVGTPVVAVMSSEAAIRRQPWMVRHALLSCEGDGPLGPADVVTAAAELVGLQVGSR